MKKTLFTVKKTLTLFFVAISVTAFLSCESKSPQDKMREVAKKNIVNYLKKNANDPESYEEVAFFKLDSVHPVFYMSEADLQFHRDIEKYDLDKVVAIRDSVQREYEKPFLGYSMRHDFRAKNAFGAKVLLSKVFIMDTLLNVKSVEDYLAE